MATQSLATMKNNSGVAAAQDPIKMRVALLEKGKAALGAGASESVKVEREIRAAALMIANSRDLQNADPRTIYTAVSNAVNSGIGLCNGHGYLVAYNGKASFVPGWKGLIDLVARTGRATAWTGVVYAGDRFDYQLGDDPFCRHRPEGDSDDWKQATHVYAIGRIKGQDYPIVVVWTINKVIKHLNKFNKVGGKHYALKDDNNMEMYARKVVLLQALKYLPSSQDLDAAIAADHAAENAREVTIDANFVYVPDGEGGFSASGDGQQAPQDNQGQQQAAQGTQQQATTAQPSGPAPGPEDDMFPPAGQQQQQQGQQDARSAYEKLKQRLESLTDIDVLDTEASLIKDMIEDVGEQDVLTAIYRERREKLANPQPAQQQQQQAGGARRRGMSIE